MTTLFNNYSAKGCLKFYSSSDNDEKLTISIGISTDHQVKQDIYKKLSDFLENLLVDDYETEEQYESKREYQKNQKKMEKAQAKYLIDQEKLSKKKMKVETKKVKKTTSLY